MVSEVTEASSCESIDLFDARNDVDTLRNGAEKHIEEGKFDEAVNDILALEELYGRGSYERFEIDRAIMSLCMSLFFKSYSHTEQLASKLSTQFEINLSPIHFEMVNNEKTSSYEALSCDNLDQLELEEALECIKQIDDEQFRSYAFSSLAHCHPTQAERLLGLAHNEIQAIEEVTDRLDASLEIAAGYAYFEMSDKEASVLKEMLEDISLLEGEDQQFYKLQVDLHEVIKCGFMSRETSFLKSFKNLRSALKRLLTNGKRIWNSSAK